MTAVHCAKYVLGQINKFIPRVLGDGILSRSDFHLLIEHDNEIVAHDCSDLSDSAKTIGHFVASLIDDGATLQMGIGDIPNAVLSNLVHHKHLGIHTEMFSDGVIPLLESGVVDNRYKKIHPYKVVSSFALGSRKLYDFLDNNSLMQFMGSDFVNDPRVILKNPKVCAINSALEVDLTGQVCADSIGPKIYSGVGGQVDFMRGAALSEGGKAIIALPSRTGRGLPKIVSGLRAGTGVVTSRAHVQFIVTEFGIADLRGKSLKERTRLLIQLAHPDDRENLEREAHQFNWV
jgi:acyl-CoA hydrolase